MENLWFRPKTFQFLNSHSINIFKVYFPDRFSISSIPLQTSNYCQFNPTPQDICQVDILFPFGRHVTDPQSLILNKHKTLTSFADPRDKKGQVGNRPLMDAFCIINSRGGGQTRTRSPSLVLSVTERREDNRVQQLPGRAVWISATENKARADPAESIKNFTIGS